MTRSMAKASSRNNNNSSNINESFSFQAAGANDEQVRYLLTLKALPEGLRVIAQLLHPQPQTAIEEHRLACRLLSENDSEQQLTKHKEISVPKFKHLPRLRTIKDAETAVEGVSRKP